MGAVFAGAFSFFALTAATLGDLTVLDSGADMVDEVRRRGGGGERKRRK